MYNGIGVQTARGTGTNGYVQRNLAHVQCSKMPMPYTQYQGEEDIKKLEEQLNREPNKELMLHERKRQVEIKCAELEDLMEEQGYKQEEITEKINDYRKLLLEELEREKKRKDVNSIEEDENGRQFARDSHGKAILQKRKNDSVKNAFGIGDDYVHGSAYLNIKKAGGLPNILPPTSEQKTKMEQEAAEKTEKFEERYTHENLATRQEVKEEEESSSSSSDSSSSDSESSSDEEEEKKPEPAPERRRDEDRRERSRHDDGRRDRKGHDAEDKKTESKKDSPPSKSHASRQAASSSRRQRSSPSPKRSKRERSASSGSGNEDDRGERRRKSSRSPNARRVTSSSRRRDDSRERRRERDDSREHRRDRDDSRERRRRH